MEWLHRQKVICLATFGRQVQNNCNFFVTEATLGQAFFQKTLYCPSTKKIFRPACCKTEESFQCESDAKDFGWVGKFPTRCSEESGHFYFPGNWIKLGYCRKRKYLPNQKSNLIFDKSFPKKKVFSLLIRFKKENNSSQFEFWHLLKSKDLIYFLSVRASAS